MKRSREGAKAAKVVRPPAGWRRLSAGERIRRGDYIEQWEGGFKPFPINMRLGIPVQPEENIIRKTSPTSPLRGHTIQKES